MRSEEHTSELCSKQFRPVWTGFLTNLYNRQPVAVAVLPNFVENWTGPDWTFKHYIERSEPEQNLGLKLVGNP